MRTMTSPSFLASSLLFAFVFALGSARPAHAQADLIIATNAEVILPASVDTHTYHYFFTVVDDGGGIVLPTITNLGYDFTPPNMIDSYDNGEFTYATFEFAVTVPSPDFGQTVSDCFTITYEGESVNPCFDVTKAPREMLQSVPACVHSMSGVVRIVAADAVCRPLENRIELAVATQNPAALTVTTPAAPRRQPQ